jgi:hypothetical protein
MFGTMMEPERGADHNFRIAADVKLIVRFTSQRHGQSLLSDITGGFFIL